MNADALRATALRLIAGNGRPITFKRSTPGATNVTTGRPAAPTVISAVASTVVVPQGRYYGAEKYGDSQLVAEHERLCYIAASGMTITGASVYVPLPGDDVLDIEGRDWKVARTFPWNPDGSGYLFHETVIE